MDNELFMHTELPPPPEMAVHFEQPSSSSAMLNWALMDPNLSRNSPPQDCFPWEKSTEHQQQQQQSIFDSALSSLVSSPTQSNSNFSGGNGGDGFIIRELIGKLGNIGNTSGEIYGAPMGSNNGKVSRSASCYATPMSSPPPPMMNRSTTPLTEFSGDPGFAERAAKFSCFGSRSFNGRSNSGIPVNNGKIINSGKLTRVSSTPALNALASPEFASAASRPMMIPAGDSTPKLPGEFSRKRKSVSKGKSKETTASPSPSFSKTAERKEDWDGKVSKVSEEEKGGKRRREDQEDGEEEEGGNKSNNTKPPEPPKDYIHVRARRGQATDSHSLAERVYQQSIGAVCGLDWPKERMLVQVLDDSSELDVQILITAEVQKWQQRGVGILYRHRLIRTGYKAGNLKAEMSCEYVKDCEIVAIFDADLSHHQIS